MSAEFAHRIVIVFCSSSRLQEYSDHSVFQAMKGEKSSVSAEELTDLGVDETFTIQCKFSGDGQVV